LSAATSGCDVSEDGTSGIEWSSMDSRPVLNHTETEYHVRVDPLSDTAAIVAVVGDADLYSAPDLRDRLNTLIDDGVHRIVLDLSQTTFIDSMALGVFLGAKKRLEAQGGGLDVVVSKPELRRIFEITMLDRVLPLAATREDALAELGPPHD
jgi:anti-sigma B factor antagonist